MESFQWSEVFLTGLPEVDRQHSRLVDVINKFGDIIVQENFLSDDVNSILKELIEYSHYHFKEEEEMFFNIGIDHRHSKEHCDEHKHFLHEIAQIENELCKSDNSSLDYDKAQSLFRFLTHWLAYHILGADKNMAKQIHAIQSGTNPENAYIDENYKEDMSKEPLLKALHGLFEEISKRNRELVQLNQTLEMKVEERTRQLYEANCNLEKLSMTDVLTELPNRRYAMIQLKKLWELSSKKGEPLSCMMIDADGFKQINDTYGHDAGDIVLKVLSKELSYAVRNDDIVSRLGGDEFLIICPNTDKDGAVHIANIIQQKIDRLRVPAGEGVWRGSVSIGVAARLPDMKDFEELIKLADKGVYAAKKAGKNCVRSC